MIAASYSDRARRGASRGGASSDQQAHAASLAFAPSATAADAIAYAHHATSLIRVCLAEASASYCAAIMLAALSGGRGVRDAFEAPAMRLEAR